MRTFNAVLYLSFFPLAVVSLLAMAAWSVEDFLKEIQYLEALQQIRPNAMSLPKLLDALEHKIQATGSMTPSSLLKLTSTWNFQFANKFEVKFARSSGSESWGCFCLFYEAPSKLPGAAIFVELLELQGMGDGSVCNNCGSCPCFCQQTASSWCEVYERADKETCFGFAAPSHDPKRRAQASPPWRSTSLATTCMTALLLASNQV